MRTRALCSMTLLWALAVHGCNETKPTTPPEPGGEAPTMPYDEAADDDESNEVFEDEPEPEDERDVLDGG